MRPWLDRLLRRAGELGVWLRDTLQLIHPTWLVVLLLAALWLAMTQAQSGEVLRAAFDQSSRTGLILGPTVFVHAGALLVAISSWYSARFLLAFRFGRLRIVDGEEQFIPHAPDRFAREGWWGPAIRSWWPRILGLVPLVLMTGRFAWVRAPGHTALMAALTLAFLAFVVLRRRLGWFGVESKPRWEGRRPDKGMLFGAAVLLGLNGCVLLYLMVGGPEAARRVGAAGILLFALAGWITLGSFALVYPGHALFDRHWWPRTTPFLMVLAWILVMAPWTGNHDLRTSGALTSTEVRPTLEQQLDAWLGSRPGEVPIIIASAEGGGIRAAYWTASALAELSDRVPGFACHLFAVSGVSGGSVGAVVYAAALAQQAGQHDPCARPTTEALRETIRSVVSADHLSPPLSGLVSNDLFQRFVPTALFRFDDRAASFEQGWELSWPQSERADVTLASDFRSLWGDGRAARVPSLFLNTTLVETGGRAIVANVQWPERRFGDAAPGVTTLRPVIAGFDLLSEIGERIPLSTAAHASARFPLISPAGTVHSGGSGEVWGRVVDGGYFENSGGLTASEVAAYVERRCTRCRVIRLAITNDPAHPALFEGLPEVDPPASNDGREASNVSRCQNVRKHASAGGIEAAAIVGAFWAGRSARGQLAEWVFLDGAHRTALRMRPRKDLQDPALGWLLDGPSRRNLEAQVDAIDTAGVGALLTGTEVAEAQRRLDGACVPPLPSPSEAGLR